MATTPIYVTPQDLKSLKVIKSQLSTLEEYKKSLPQEFSKTSYDHLVDLSNVLVKKQVNTTDQTALEFSDFTTLNELNNSLVDTNGQSEIALTEFFELKKKGIDLLNHIFGTTNSAIIESLNVTYQNMMRNNSFTVTEYNKIGNLIFDWVHINVPVSCAVDLFTILNKLAVSEQAFLTTQNLFLMHTSVILTPLMCITVGAVNNINFKKFCTPHFLQN
jgi:hypothetical protein